MGLLFKSIIYTTSLIGIFTLLPIYDDNVTFTKYSVTPQSPLIGPFASNEKLSGINKIFENQFKGPEHLLYYNNTLYTSVHLGHVLQIVDNQITPIVKFGKLCDGFHEEHICGRPLGLFMEKNGFLYVADAYYGIFKVNVKSENEYGTVQQLVSMEHIIDGFRPKLPNSVIVASDGIVYWTDSDTNFALHDAMYTLFTDGTGRLLKYDQKTRKNTVLLKNIHFANGLEISNDESFILISETGKYRVLKYYLKGPKTGNTEVFVDGLPGMPDNIKKIGKFFYFPLVMQRLPVFDYIREYPIIRMMIYKFLRTIDITFQAIDLYFPNIYSKKAVHWVGHFESLLFLKSIFDQRFSLIKVNEKGVVVSSFHSTDKSILGTSDVEIINDKLYFGSPFNIFIGVINVPYGFL